jgi:insulysin
LPPQAKSAPIPDELALPRPNDFIPQNVDVKKVEGAEPKEVPALIADTPVSQLWWKKDDRFWVPRANFWVGMRSPLLDASPLNAATARLFTDLFRDFMSEETYAAELAGLKVSVMYSGGNIILSTSGYNDRLGVLMKTAVEKLKAFKIDPERFELLKDDVRARSALAEACSGATILTRR